MRARKEAEPLLVAAEEVAGMLGVSERTVRRLDAAGKLPRAARIGGNVRWRAAEVERWVAAGCPPRLAWETET